MGDKERHTFRQKSDSDGENTEKGGESKNTLKVNREAGRDMRNASRLCLFQVTPAGIQTLSPCLLLSFINSRINMAAALTPGLEEPISGLTYKTHCSFRALFLKAYPHLLW